MSFSTLINPLFSSTGSGNFFVGYVILITLSSTIYVLYHLFFHRLSKFPGPFLASFTNLWKIYHVVVGDYERALLNLHRKYGQIVRIGPNHLDVSDSQAVKAIFGSGRTFQKSTYYDAFTALRPNLFGARNEEVHTARRKAVANSFSAQSVNQMEVYIDRCMVKLINRLDLAARSGEEIDLKQWIAFLVLDVLGELAFSRPFGVLDSGDVRGMPPIEQHVLLATMSGQTPWLIPYINKFLPYIPIPSLQRMVRGRAGLRRMAIESVNNRLAIHSERKDLLGRLLEELEVGEDSKGRQFDIVDVQTEAFGFIIAGSHTTAASTTYALWHLLRTPSALARLRKEIDTVPEPEDSSPSYPSRSTNNLEYLQAVISEGFRINPVFVMPLMRVVPEGGREIASAYIPAGTDVSICNHALHHDEDVFGPDLETFTPERWLDDKYDRSGYLMPFGAGHRACVGRNIALMEIQKMLVSLLARYDIELVALEEERSLKMPPTHSFGVSDLKGGMPVRLKFRKPWFE